MAATQLGDDDSGQAPDARGGDGTRNFVPAKGGPLEAPFASDPRTSSCYSTAYVPQSTVLFREPGGEPRLRITKRTEWGSPRVLGVVGQRGDWLGVQASELKNGEVAWIPRERTRVDCVRWSLHADLSKRELFVRKDGHTVRKFPIAIGSRGHTTPLGRFSVTDKLKVTNDNSPYGCCVLALTGHQTDLPDGLARRRPARGARDDGPEQHRQGGEPRLHAGALRGGALAHIEHAARRSDLRPLLSRSHRTGASSVSWA